MKTFILCENKLELMELIITIDTTFSEQLNLKVVRKLVLEVTSKSTNEETQKETII